MKKRILVLFPKEWDRLEFARPEYADRYEFVYAGFDLFRFPHNARLLTFDVFRFVNDVVAHLRRERVDRFEELRRHLSFWPFEKYLIKRLVKPFNDLLPWYTD